MLATKDDAHAGTIALNGPLTTNAAPDLADTSPSGGLVFVALRGPTPLSGDPHNAQRHKDTKTHRFFGAPQKNVCASLCLCASVIDYRSTKLGLAAICLS